MQYSSRACYAVEDITTDAVGADSSRACYAVEDITTDAVGADSSRACCSAVEDITTDAVGADSSRACYAVEDITTDAVGADSSRACCAVEDITTDAVGTDSSRACCAVEDITTDAVGADSSRACCYAVEDITTDADSSTARTVEANESSSMFAAHHLEWGTMDAEINVPSVENPELTCAPVKAWSRWEYGYSCLVYWQEFFPCPRRFYFSGLVTFSFSKIHSLLFNC